MNELVSIVVPVYNCSKFILDTINSITNQSYTNWELLLVDDMSTDNSCDIINNYIKISNDNRIRLIKLRKKGMAAGARNKGVKEAKGKYLCYLDADDFWDNDKLLKQVKFMKDNNYAFTFTGYEFSKEDMTLTGKKVYVPKSLNYKQALKNTIIWTSTVMFNLDIIKKKDIMMPTIPSEDTACWWSVLRLGYTAYGLNEVLSFYRRSSNTLSSNKFEAIKRIWNLYRSFEGLGLFYSIYNFIFYAINTVKKRI